MFLKTYDGLLRWFGLWKSNSPKNLPQLSFLLIIFILTACKRTSSQIPSTPSINQPVTPLSTVVITRPLPSSPDAQQSKPTNLSSPIAPAKTPSLTPNYALQTQCLDVRFRMPSDAKFSGKLVFSEYGADGSSFLINLENGLKQMLPEFGDFYVSPNADRLAYSITSADKKPEKRQIVIVSNDGREQQRIVWGEQHMFALAGWLDNERLVLNYEYAPDAPWSVLIFKPFIRERENILIDFPDFCFCADAMSSAIFASAPLVLDPSLKFTVYPRWGRIDEGGGFYFAIWDRQEGRELAKIREGADFFIDPLWNRVGEFFVIAASTDVDHGRIMEWYRVSKTGDVRQLTHFGESYSNAVISSASLSPDGRYLAFWLDIVSYEGRNQQLAVLDLTTEITKDYCIPGDNTSAPIWSPDGRYLVVENNPEVNYYVEIMVDTVDGWAAQFSENMHPYGWLKAP